MVDLGNQQNYEDIDYAKSLYDKIIVNTQCVLENIDSVQAGLPNKLVCTDDTIRELIDLAKNSENGGKWECYGIHISDWDVSLVTDMSVLFADKEILMKI